LESIRLFGPTFTQFIKFAHSVTPYGSVGDRTLTGVALLKIMQLDGTGGESPSPPLPALLLAFCALRFPSFFVDVAALSQMS
jgi:hypothetical protein